MYGFVDSRFSVVLRFGFWDVRFPVVKSRALGGCKPGLGLSEEGSEFVYRKSRSLKRDRLTVLQGRCKNIILVDGKSRHALIYTILPELTALQY